MINLSASRKKYDPCAKIESPFAALRAQLLGGCFSHSSRVPSGLGHYGLDGSVVLALLGLFLWKICPIREHCMQIFTVKPLLQRFVQSPSEARTTEASRPRFARTLSVENLSDPRTLHANIHREAPATAICAESERSEDD